MQRLMIVDTHGALGKAIERRLGDEFYIGVRCSDEMLAEEIVSFCPDILLMDIMYPAIRRLQVLQAVVNTLPDMKVLVIATVLDEYTVSRLVQLELYSAIAKPCAPDYVASKIRDAAFAHDYPDKNDWCLENEIDRLLLCLGFRMGSNRYNCVFEAIRIRYHSMDCSTKELYIDVAKSCGGSYRRVEKAIRDAVADAYENSDCDTSLWAAYFPACGKREKPYPGNEEFIARAAGYMISKTRLRRPCHREAETVAVVE
ncbi:MAG: hypothetical protein IKU07_03780 [Oscillospiraceae bacterium]|nr:hypothetical protein [Oscillospiraceae bacterium]